MSPTKPQPPRKFVTIFYAENRTDQGRNKLPKYSPSIEIECSLSIKEELAKEEWDIIWTTTNNDESEAIHYGTVLNTGNHPLRLDNLLRLAHDLINIALDKNDPEIVTASRSKHSDLWSPFKTFLEFYKEKVKSSYLRQLEVSDFLKENYGFKVSRGKTFIHMRIEFD